MEFIEWKPNEIINNSKTIKQKFIKLIYIFKKDNQISL